MDSRQRFAECKDLSLWTSRECRCRRLHSIRTIDGRGSKSAVRSSKFRYLQPIFILRQCELRHNDRAESRCRAALVSFRSHRPANPGAAVLPRTADGPRALPTIPAGGSLQELRAVIQTITRRIGLYPGFAGLSCRGTQLPWRLRAHGAALR